MQRNSLSVLRGLRRMGPLLLAAYIALVPSKSYSAGRRLNLTCEVDDVYGPDGQPYFIVWKIDLRRKKVVAGFACPSRGCSLTGDVDGATDDEILLRLRGTTGTIQLFDINRRTGEFSSHNTRNDHTYGGTCRETAKKK